MSTLTNAVHASVEASNTLETGGRSRKNCAGSTPPPPIPTNRLSIVVGRMLFLFGLDSIPFTVLVTLFPVRLSTDEHHGPGAAGWGEEDGDGRRQSRRIYVHKYVHRLPRGLNVWDGDLCIYHMKYPQYHSRCRERIGHPPKKPRNVRQVHQVLRTLHHAVFGAHSSAPRRWFVFAIHPRRWVLLQRLIFLRENDRDEIQV